MTYTLSITDEKGKVIRSYAGIPAKMIRAFLAGLDHAVSLAAQAAAVKRTVDVLTGNGQPRRLP